LKNILLKSIRDDWIDILDLMGKGDVSQLSFREICELCTYISRGKAKIGKNPRDPAMSRINNSSTRTIIRE